MTQGVRWTEQQIDLMAPLWAEGLGCVAVAQKINERCGTDVSAKAVRIRARRMGLPVHDYAKEWEPEVVARSLVLRDIGHSSSEVARMLNEEFSLSLTRNALLGRWFRMGLPARAKVTFRKPPPKPRAIRIKPFKAPKIKPQPKPKPIPAEIQDALIPFEQRKQLIDLGSNDCRWPVGDVGEPGFFFCGGKTEDGCSYCPAHEYRSREHRARKPFVPWRNQSWARAA